MNEKIIYDPYTTIKEQMEGEDKIKKEFEILEQEQENKRSEMETLSNEEEKQINAMKDKFKLHEIHI